MTKFKEFAWKWIDSLGNPTNEDLMPSRFSAYKILFYLVRESVQNTIDAWLEFYKNNPKGMNDNPAIIKFDIGEATKDLSPWFSGLKEAREHLDKQGEHQTRYSEKLNYKKPNWLLIQDLNTGGIQGSVQDRTSDFWNFLLNWGRSNKRKSSVSTGGSKGVGRISFPLASRSNSVFNITKRQDGTFVSGFALLSTSKINKNFKDAFAIFADEKDNSIWKLHDKTDDFIEDFKIEDLKKSSASGTALIIPFPREEITERNDHFDQIKAAFIENYAPLIIRKDLEPWAGGDKLDDSNITSEASRIKDLFVREDFKNNGAEFISFCREAIYEIELKQDIISLELDELCDLEGLDLGDQIKERITNKLSSGERVLFRINFYLVKNGKKEKTYIDAAFSRPSTDEQGNFLQGVEVYYRNGMSMMSQDRYLGNSNIHAALFCKDQYISTYLNIWEDEGHSRWTEGENEKKNALEKGYDKEFYLRPVRLCKRALRLLHIKFVDEVDEIDDTSLSQFFSFPTENERTPITPVPPIPPSPPALYDVVKINGGFRVRPNSKAKKLPKNGITIRAKFKSDPMLRTSGYKPQDFDFSETPIQTTNCMAKGNKNRIDISKIKKGFQVDVTGMDTNRELVISPRSY